MSHIETLTKYVGHFVDALWRNGVEQVVISPGSRSTPLALMMTEHPQMKQWVNLDERSAAFFALGLAKESQKPVALVCTSGTAAANYMPAVVEAFYSRIPLILLTADRPHELRDVGAPQAINQIQMYGGFVKWFHEMMLPEANPAALRYVQQQASRAMQQALEGNPGPVHLNFPFREPLTPDFTIENIWSSGENAAKPALYGSAQLDANHVQQLVEILETSKKGLIVVGPQEDKEFANAVVHFAEKWQLPILADPLSQLRSGAHVKDVIIETYDTILKSESVRSKLQPDFIIRFGAMPVSKPYLFLMKEYTGNKHIVVEKHAGYREPVGMDTQFIYADPTMLCESLASIPATKPETWLPTWQEMNRIAQEVLHDDMESKELTEGIAVQDMLRETPEDSNVFVGNSMPIRDLDSFFFATDKQIQPWCNRGTNGIDGVVSTALGVAAGGKRTTLVIGDLSFYHDMNGLMLGRNYGLDLTIIVINNNGGGIFSFLPQAQEAAHFEALFGTPTNLDFAHTAGLYHLPYTLADDRTAFSDALQESYNRKGMHIIEVRTERDANVSWHREKWQKAERQLLDYLDASHA
ncbi:2-succinyl-5-enolpyruvyl-6-hydroxy-3-cyclohexene-1-carboxylic-acid synthase [Terribacillus saccharophilus]|uniref:2-succinyl-5-enolpyruvyl-6-hydroxy-3- cyclohexene-1-carboxylic-acid synthase n=1 Tax=Terribacillus saccharophilus TaxID=361277 RepID=UPI000BA5BF21|nr:2-succinyl-5-enolpyruvyl-6-hydroxy-3-cyclohexene-1-carboxylic-acid synthase [Terribacillus saccharophilus]PAF34368.1 2-succinyl-5-enolpyruvyl-6-hydroxy-3-cyclohexene-1-carboxylic-acid synthase [Terribacillus saccharophilus]